jgi:hypothetical protein
MTMSLPDGEPAATSWSAVGVGDLLRRLLDGAPRHTGPAVLAVDGRSAAGKSTLAERLVEQAISSGGHAIVLHTDDVAWNHSFFDWAEPLVDGILGPARRGGAVRFQPPGWTSHGRAGALEVPASTDLVVVEGVGAGRQELSRFLDALVWVQSDAVEAERRGLARDNASGVNGDEAQTVAFWHEWMDQELGFLAADRPWERAHAVVAGTPTIPLRPGEVAVSAPVGR